VESGAIAACHTGSKFAILHCTSGANLGAGDRMPAGKVKSADAMQMEGSVFVGRQPMGSISEIASLGWCRCAEPDPYEFLYAGRLSPEVLPG
jgi:hypothetical protein